MPKYRELEMKKINKGYLFFLPYPPPNEVPKNTEKQGSFASPFKSLLFWRGSLLKTHHKTHTHTLTHTHTHTHKHTNPTPQHKTTQNIWQGLGCWWSTSFDPLRGLTFWSACFFSYCLFVLVFSFSSCCLLLLLGLSSSFLLLLLFSSPSLAFFFLFFFCFFYFEAMKGRERKK